MNLHNGLLRSILTGSLIFYGLSGLTSLLNYAFYPAIARVVDTSTYGEVQFLTSLFMQLAVGFIVLNIITIIITAKYTVDHERQKALQALNAVAITAILVIVVVGSALLFIGKGPLGFTSPLPIAMLGLSLLINVPFTITIGKLQGEGKFVRSGIVSASSALFKLAFALLFVLSGWGATGAMAGIAVGLAVAIGLGHLMDGRRLPTLPTPKRKALKSLVSLYVSRLTHFKTERPLLLAALVAVGILSVLSTADVLVSKILLPPYEAGQYAGVATVAKIILYATTPLMWLALPLALADLAHTRARVRRYVLITAAVGVGLLALFTTLQSSVVTGLLDIDPGVYGSLLPLASVAMVIFSLAFIVIAVDLCRDKLRVTTAATLGALAAFILCFAVFNRGDVVRAAIVGQIAAASIAMVVSLIGNRVYGKNH